MFAAHRSILEKEVDALTTVGTLDEQRDRPTRKRKHDDSAADGGSRGNVRSDVGLQRDADDSNSVNVLYCIRYI